MMSSPFRLLIAIPLLASCALPLAAQEQAVSNAQPQAVAPLSVEECVARALKRNFDIQIQAFSTDAAKESLVIARADYSPDLTASAKRSGSGAYGGATSNNDLQTRVGVSQKISTGATISASTALDRGASSGYTASLNPAYNSDLSLSISQPLLKGAGSDVNMASINRAKIGVDRASLDYRGQVLQVIRNVETAYFNLYFAREQLGVREHSLKLAQTLLDESRTRKNVGNAIELDVLQAEVGEATARRNVLQARQSVKNNEDNLTSLIGQFEFDTPVGTVSFPETPISQPSFDFSYKLARDNEPNFLSTQASIQQLEIDATSAKNGRLPSLNLDSALGYNAREGSAGKAFRELPGSDGYSWQVGLSLNLPWGLKAENARYRNALSTLNQSRARLRQLEQSLVVQVRSAVRSVETNLESVVISSQATQLSVKKYEAEKARLDAGLSTARRVLEAIDDLENNKVSELQSKVSLRIAVSELHRLESSSLKAYNIILP